MTTAHKIASALTVVNQPADLPGSIGLHLPAFKRKRIEQWCLDVAQYLKAGSMCRSVIGHVIEDSRVNSGVTNGATNTLPKSAPAGSGVHGRAPSTVVGTTTTTTTTTINAVAAGSGTSCVTIGIMTDSLIGNKKVGPAVSVMDKVGGNTSPGPGRNTPMPDPAGPLPVVKFSYSHYNEQRRRIDRLVQGLPVLPSPGAPNGLDRVTTTAATGVVIYVNGEEQVRASSRERQSRSPDPGSGPQNPPGPRSNSRSSSTEPRLQQRGSSIGPRNRNTSPAPGGGRPPQKNTMNGVSSSHYHNNNNNVMSSEIVVIEDGYPHHHPHHQNVQGPPFGSSELKGPAGLRSLNVKVPSQKVAKARQRVLAGARRSRDPNSIAPTHMPVQSCWAMAELTW